MRKSKVRIDNSMEYVIGKAKNDEKETIVDFFNKEWKKSQMINESKMFDFYYKNGNELQFVLAKRKKDNHIVGASGFFLSSEDDVWLSNTCIKSGENPFLIFHILEYFKMIATNIHDVNCTDNMKSIFKKAGFWTGEYIHFFRTLREKDFKVIQIPDQLEMPSIEGCLDNVKEIRNFEEMPNISYECKNMNPKKNIKYIWHRYKEFPYDEFKYKIWLAEYEEKHAIIVTREQLVQDSAILRIVDIIGHEICLKSAIRHFVDLGKKRGCEYIDCFCCGISIEEMRKCGFLDNTKNLFVIPDNFSPLLMDNVNINYATNNIQGFRAFKADGDMDRPNLWR